MPRAEFAKCTKIAHQPDAPRDSSECILSYFAASKEDVDAILKRANAASGAVSGEAEDQPWGFSEYFTDPDGHLWEIMWKPTLVTHLLNSASSAAFACHPSLYSTRHHRKIEMHRTV